MGSTYDFLEGADSDDEQQPGYFGFGGRAPRMYGCQNCHAPITFAFVLYMGKIIDNSFILGYTCGCGGHKTMLENRFQVDRQAMRRLLGRLRPHLPYRAAPGPYLGQGKEAEDRIKVFAFDLDGIDGLDDFLLYLDGPGSGRRRGPTPA